MVESLLEMLTKRKNQMFYKPMDVHSMTNAIVEISYSFSNKHVEYCESVG